MTCITYCYIFTFDIRTLISKFIKMKKFDTWKTSCKVCHCDAYFYDFDISIELTKSDKKEDRLVNITCEGCKGEKHTLKYTFPKEFKKA